jgi:hypothetical protein
MAVNASPDLRRRRLDSVAPATGTGPFRVRRGLDQRRTRFRVRLLLPRLRRGALQGKVREGLKLCEHSLKIQYYEADNHWNLARVQIVSGERLAAFQTISRGLKLDPTHEGLLQTQKEIGVRRRPVLGFLSRDHPLNIWLGRLRHGNQSAKS